MLDGDDLVRFVLTARDLETDELIRNRQGVTEMAADSEQSLDYEVPIGQIFKLEVAVQDLRSLGSDFGVFRAVTDIVVGTKGVLEPAIGEVQQIILPSTITDAISQNNQIELSLENAPDIKITSDLNDFLGSNIQAIEQSFANAIVSLNDEVTSVSQINVNVFTQSDAGPDGGDGLVIEVIYDDIRFVGADMPMFNATVTIGGVVQPDIENEFDVYVDGKFSGERMYHFFETRNRNVGTGTSNVYGRTRVIGSFDNDNPTADIFDEVGGLGPINGGGIRDQIPEFDRSIAYDAFAIPVIARSLASNVLVELDAPDVGDKVLIYGTVADKEGVADDQIQFGGNSRLFLNVTPPKPLLEASNASRSLVEDQGAITIDLSRLVAADPGALTYSLASSTSLGTSELSGTTLTYTPVANAFGTETLAYRVARDATTDIVEAEITFEIVGINDAPVANDDVRATREDNSLSISVAGLLENDTDVDIDDTLTLVSIGTANHGRVNLDGDTIMYHPSADFFGEDHVVYTISDHAGITQTATVRIDVIAVNDPPTATGETARTNPNTPIHFAIADLLANDSAGPLESAQNLTITEVHGLTDSTSSVVIDGNFIRYTPAPEFTGSDGFNYTVSDGLATATASMNVTVEFVIEPIHFSLPNATSNDITVRRSDGTHLEILDNSTSPPTRLLRRPLDTITALTISGNDASADRVQIDHASGGLITFIGNSSTIEVVGGQSTSDQLSLTGLSGFNVLLAEADSQSPSIHRGLLADVQFGALVSHHTVSGFEIVSVEDVRQISVPSASILDVDAYQLNLDSELPVDLSRDTRINGGTLTSVSPIAVARDEQVTGNGSIIARIVASSESLISALGGDLTLGTSSFSSSIEIAGRINTGGNHVILIDADTANLRGIVTLGGVGEIAGSITSFSGITIQPGAEVFGHGSIHTGDDEASGLNNNGRFRGSSPTLPITINGRLLGTGTLSNVEVTGRWSPADLINDRLDGNVALAPTATIAVDIGGIVAGSSHDRFRFDTTVSIGGTLDVNFVNEFSPSAGHEFEIITASDSLTDQFDTINLPELIDGLAWDVRTTATGLTLQVALDPTAIGESVRIEVDAEDRILILGRNDQPIPIAGNQLTLDVQATQRFSSPQTWIVQPKEVVAGEIYQIATNGSTTLRITGAPWTNFFRRFDINGNGIVTSVDALVIINELNSPQYSSRETSRLNEIDPALTLPNLYFDANGDGSVSAVDALQVINQLIQQDALGEPLDSAARISTPMRINASPLISTETEFQTVLAGGNPLRTPPQSTDIALLQGWGDDQTRPWTSKASDDAKKKTGPNHSTLENTLSLLTATTSIEWVQPGRLTSDKHSTH